MNIPDKKKTMIIYWKDVRNENASICFHLKRSLLFRESSNWYYMYVYKDFCWCWTWIVFMNTFHVSNKKNNKLVNNKEAVTIIESSRMMDIEYLIFFAWQLKLVNGFGIFNDSDLHYHQITGFDSISHSVIWSTP